MSQDLYPINFLRNVALEQVLTDYVFLNDVDFMPIPNMYKYLRSFIHNRPLSEITKKVKFTLTHLQMCFEIRGTQ